MGRKEKKVIRKLEWDLEKQKRKNNMEHTIFLIVMSCIYIAIGGFLVFVPQPEIVYLCYTLCAGLITYGIILIVRYFVKELYKKLHDYSFSAGVLLVILGSCALARAQEVAANITLYLGLCVLITSIVALQNAIQLKTLNSSLWPTMLAISCLAIICAVLIIADMQFMSSIMLPFTCWVLMIDGVISVVSLAMVYISIRNFAKRQEQEPEMTEETPEPDVEEEEITAELGMQQQEEVLPVIKEEIQIHIEEEAQSRETDVQ